MDFGTFAAKLSGFIWGVPLIVLLTGTHLFLTFRTGFIQKFLLRAIKLSSAISSRGLGRARRLWADLYGRP